MAQPKPHRILLVDDHEMMRMGLKTLAALHSDLPVEWLEASNLSDGMEMHERETEHASAIDLVLLDMNLPDSQGLQSLQRFMLRCPSARVALFSGTEDTFVMKQALSLGAVGFVPKSAQASATLNIIEALLVGNQPLVDTLTMPLNESFSSRSPAVKLSPTQVKVLALILEGMSNQEIANECSLALGSVKNMVSSIMLTLEVTSRSHLISLFR